MRGAIFDVWTDELIFHLDVNGFGDLNFGAAVHPAIDGVELWRRLEVDGMCRPRANFTFAHHVDRVVGSRLCCTLF